MATTLPVPVEFALPEGWQAAPPDEVGAPGAAFVALHRASHGSGFTANITVDGEYREDDATLTAIADASVDQLRGVSESVARSQRRELGSGEAPGLAQVLEVSTMIDGTQRPLVQYQVYLSMPDLTDSRRRAVVRLVLTATPGQLDAVTSDFQEFVSSVRPAPNG